MSNRYYSNRLRKVAERKSGVRKRSQPRPKSFKTEEAAKKWAEANKITDYVLRNLKSAESKIKKLIIVKK